MTRFASQSAAFVAALFVTGASLNAIVTVPAVEAAVIIAPVLA